MTTKVLSCDPRLAVRLTSGTPRPRRIFRICGGALPREFGVHENNVRNLVRGLTERVYNVEVVGPDGIKRLSPPPKPGPGVIRESLAGFRRKLLRELPKVAPRTLEEVVASYKGDRRHAVYQRAASEVEFRGVSKLDARLTTFVKAEKIDIQTKGDPAPRVIQPRHPRYNVVVARYLKHLEKLVYKGIASVWGSTTVLKGYNGVERAGILRTKWQRFNDPVAVGLDASRFDQHCSVDALRWEHGIYKACYASPNDRQALGELLAWQIDNQGVGRATDGYVKYRVKGCRMSGDMNTALGNCLLMSAMVWAYTRHVGVECELANDGDDCVVILDRADLQRFQSGVRAWFLKMGYTMKVEEPVDVFEQIEFCQSHPVLTVDGWVMVRDPARAMAKDCHSLLPLDDAKLALGLCTALGEGGSALCAGVPVCQAFYEGLVRNGRGVKIGAHPAMESGFQRLCAGVGQRSRVVSDESRISFFRAFGILPSTQVMLEDQLGVWAIDWSVERRETSWDPTGFWQYYTV